MNIETLWIVIDGPVDLGSDSGDETKISTDVVPNMNRVPAWLQELKEINQSIQVENVELRRVQQEA